MTSDLARQRFKAIAGPFLDDAYALARWMTNSPTDAEDVAQDACLRALRALETTSPEHPRAWFLALTRHAALDWLARNRRREQVPLDEAQEAALFELARAALTPEDALIDANESAVLHAAIAALPLVFRETLIMRELNDLSYREIALATGAPIGTVMSRLARARTLLAEKIGAPS